MPRGYLRSAGREGATSSRKMRRGGSSKRAEWHKTPGWVRHENNIHRRGRKQQLKSSLDFEMVNQQYYNTTDGYWLPDDDDDDEEDPANFAYYWKPVEQDLWGHYFATENRTEIGNQIEAAHDDVIQPKENSEERPVDSQADHSSYSFCEEFHNYDEEPCSSFSLVDSMEDTLSKSESEGSSSSLWDFVGPIVSDPNRMIHQTDTLSRDSSSWEILGSLSRDDSTTSMVSFCPEIALEDDAASYGSNFVGNIQCNKPTQQPQSFRLAGVAKKCAICLEERPDVLRLMHKCRHPEACISCLRTHYIKNTLHSDDDQYIVSHFPLTCFWQGCNRHLRDVQIRYLTESSHDLSRFYLMEQRAQDIRKAQSSHQDKIMKFQTIQNCRECATPNVIRPAYYTKRPMKCKQCQTLQAVSMQLIDVKSVVEALGCNLVNCPSCYIPIFKDGGCDDMTCVCGREFSFQTIQQRHYKRYKEF